MTQEERQTAVMPADYRPRKAMEYMAIFLDHGEGVDLLSDNEAGVIFKRLFQFSRDYAASYDDSLNIDTRGLDKMAAYVASNIAGGVKRAERKRRETSFGRSGANGGGRPEKG